MKNKHATRLLIFAFIALLAVSALMDVFGYLMYRDHLYSVNTNLATVYLTNTRANIAYGVSYGKSITKYYGMGEQLDAAKENFDMLDELYILDKDGKVLYTSGEAEYPESVGITSAGQSVSTGGYLYCSMPLTDDSIMVARIDSETIDESLNTFVKRMITFTVIVYVCAAALMLILTFLMRKQRESKSKLYMTSLIAVIIIGIVTLGVNVGTTCWREYQESYKKLADGVALSVERDIAKLADAGIDYGELYGVDEYLQSYTDAIPEFDAIELVEGGESTGDYVSSFTVAGADNVQITFTVDCETSDAHTRSILLQYVLNTLLLSMISLLIITEFNIFTADGETASSLKKAGEEREYIETGRMVRLIFFIIYACIKIGMSLDAIVARTLCEQAGGSSALIGIPTTAAMVGALLSVFLSAFIISRTGSLKRTLQVSVCAAVIGLVGCAFMSGIYTFAAARFLVGFGEGLAAMLLKNIAAMQNTSERRKSFLAKASGGTFAGMCMGSVLGGMLNDQLSRAYVYMIGAVGLIAVFVLILGVKLPVPTVEKKVFKGFARVLGFPPALRYLICLVIPVYVCAVFLDYVLPLAGSDFGFSTTLISTLILAYSLIAGYAAPGMTKLAGRIFKQPRSAAVAYTILTGLVILVYPVFNSAAFLIIAIVLLGVCDSFGVVYLNEGFIAASEGGGYDRSTGNTVFTMVTKGGCMIAPSCITIVGSYMAMPIVVGIGIAGYVVTGVIGKSMKKQKTGTGV